MTALAAVALAEPEPHYGYYGYPYYHQLGWPSVRAPGFSSTCWGCRGKRSAEVDNVNRVSGSSPFPSYTAAWPGATVSVNHMGKRSAEPEPHGFYGYYGYPYGYHYLGKRSADAEPEAAPEAAPEAEAKPWYGYYGYGGYYGYPYGYYGYPRAYYGRYWW